MVSARTTRGSSAMSRGSPTVVSCQCPEDDEVSPITRRLRVFNPGGLFPEAYIMLSSGDTATKDMNPSFLGRSIARDRVNIDIIRKWLGLCREHHYACRPHPDGLSRDLISSSRLRLLDLQENCLVTFVLKI